MTEVVLLEDLIVGEISLVDAGAHLRDGWNTVKARELPPTELAVIAKAEAHRITSGVVYEPLPHVDAHSEGVDPVTLSLAMLRYAATANKTLRKQHQPGTATGEVIGLLAWPAAKAVELCVPSSCSKPRLSPFTVYSITRFTPEAFTAVQNGAALGLSIGGSAKRRPGGESTAKTQTPDSGWLWTSDPRIAAVAKAAELPRLDGPHDIWAVPKTLDAGTLNAIWQATMGLAFLDVESATKAGPCRCGGCEDDLTKRANMRRARSLV
jgi:hypothetical protein